MPNRNQTFDSNGPDVRIRGSAHQVHEKYLTLARDASASGDRVLAESYFQHAEHYFRILSAFSEEAGNEGNRARANGNGGRHVFDGEQPQPDIAPAAPPAQPEPPAREAAAAAPAETDTPAQPDEPAKPTLSLRRRTNGARDRSEAGAEANGSVAVTVTVVEPEAQQSGAQQPGGSAPPLRRPRSASRARQGREEPSSGRSEDSGSED